METKNPATVKRLREEGHSFRKIADILNIGKTTAIRWFYEDKADNSKPTGFVKENLS
jgi:transposase